MRIKAYFKSARLSVLIISVLMIIIGAVLLLSFIPALGASVMNTGTYAGSVIGVITILLGISAPFVTQSKNKKIKYPFVAVLIIYAVLVVYAVILSAFMISRAGNGKPEAGRTVVVLGCQVNDRGPSLMLRGRLDKAYELLSADETLMCVVSGGQGESEPVPEAEAMKSYLVNLGIDEKRIFKEDKSTSTKENLLFSRDIIDENGLSRDIVIVTDVFHQLRATLGAEKYGYTVQNAGSETPFFLLSTFWVREWLALSYFFVFGE